MANLNISIPAIQKAFYPNEQQSSIRKKLDDIYSRYKKEIDLVSSISNVPKKLIVAFIFIESSGNPDAVSSAGAVGLMQLIPASASDILILERQKNRLTESEKNILSQKLGSNFTNGIMKMRFLGDTINLGGKFLSVFVTKNDLLDPLLNILIGSIYLGLLLDEHTEGNQIRLDKVVIRYNRGYFSDNRGKNLLGNVEQIVQKVPTESKNYVLKLLGKNGVLENSMA